MYKALSNIKFMGKLYVKDDAIDLPKKLGKQLEAEGVVEVLKETKAEKKNREDVEKKRKADKEKVKKEAEKLRNERIEKYEAMSDEELTTVLEEREIEHKDLSRENAINLLERSDRVRDENN
ncbi:hypothetical protein KAU51_04330 [Candidatus Parcubacteria bacterium]|nr:hypothetical protein [Candidatus Parcubacteria bacterium]